MQWKGKLMLAIASAWLICEELYVSSYRRQHQILGENKAIADEALGEGFFEVYDKSFSYLRNNGAPYMVEDDALRAFVRQANKYLIKKNVGKSKVMTISRWTKSYIRYIKTGMRYGLAGFADNILQALIDGYGADAQRLEAAAQAWHSVLY